MLRITVAASDGPGPVNEDLVGHHGPAVWVIDGATGIGADLLEDASDAAWLARRADRELRSVLSTEPDLPTAELLGRVMAACGDALEDQCAGLAYAPHEHPSAAFAMVRQIGSDIELSTLGDCRIAYRSAGVARLFGTTGLTHVEGRTIDLARRYLEEDPEIAPATLRDRLLPQLQANRRLMNRPGGYWVLGTDPAAAAHLDRRTVPARHGEAFALASDGYLRLVELFDVVSVDELLAIDSEAKFADGLHRLRELEREERSCHRFPRVKVHDDATFAHCLVEED